MGAGGCRRVFTWRGLKANISNMIGEHDFSDILPLVEKYSEGEGVQGTAVPAMDIVRIESQDLTLPSVYDPCLCVIVQGAKEVLLGAEVHRYVPGEFLAVSVDLPVLGRATRATPAQPYFCIKIALDRRRLSETIANTGLGRPDGAEQARGLVVGRLDAALADCVRRLVRLLETPKDISALAPVILAEFDYRLLSGAYAPALAPFLFAGANMERIAHVIRRLNEDIARPVRVEELAEAANMSPSSFHHHFKQATALSPLQYLKRLRLIEARRILLTEKAGVAGAAYRVGYESPSQFSREYARMFGAPPARDIREVQGPGVFAEGGPRPAPGVSAETTADRIAAAGQAVSR